MLDRPDRITFEDVQAATIEALRCCATLIVQKVVLDHGGKTRIPGSGEGPSLKALPKENYAAYIAALNALPTTKACILSGGMRSG